MLKLKHWLTGWAITRETTDTNTRKAFDAHSSMHEEEKDIINLNTDVLTEVKGLVLLQTLSLNDTEECEWILNLMKKISHKLLAIHWHFLLKKIIVKDYCLFRIHFTHTIRRQTHTYIFKRDLLKTFLLIHLSFLPRYTHVSDFYLYPIFYHYIPDYILIGFWSQRTENKFNQAMYPHWMVRHQITNSGWVSINRK